MMDMVEKVARALACREGGKITGPSRHKASDEFQWDPSHDYMKLYVEKHWKEHVNAAYTAIEAMLEANDEMVAAGLESLQESTGEPLAYIDRDPWLCYRAMLNRALRPLTPSPASPAPHDPQ